MPYQKTANIKSISLEEKFEPLMLIGASLPIVSIASFIIFNELEKVR